MKMVAWEVLEQAQDLSYKPNGVDFTGLAFEKEPDGTPTKDFFLHGLPWEPDRLWASNEMLLEDENWFKGNLHGVCKKWNNEGKLIAETTDVQRLKIAEKRWNEEGEMMA